MTSCSSFPQFHTPIQPSFLSGPVFDDRLNPFHEFFGIDQLLIQSNRSAFFIIRKNFIIFSSLESTKLLGCSYNSPNQNKRFFVANRYLLGTERHFFHDTF